MDGCLFELSPIPYGSNVKPCCKLVRASSERCSSKKYGTDSIVKIWCSKPVAELRKYCDVIKIYTFWPLLFENGDSITNKLYGDFGVCHRCKLSLMTLFQMETLDDVTDIVKRFANVPHFISGILKIGNDIDKREFDFCGALAWVKYADDIGLLQKLETLGDYCWPFLEVFFAEYKHYISKVVLEDYNLAEGFESQTCDNCRKTSEEWKKKGNDYFAEENFSFAILAYTKAIESWPENHFLYGNRSLCFLRTEEYTSALGDGKRSIILKPNWPKGHYRFCDALSLLGEHRKALEANERGQELCGNSLEGIKDLVQQHEKLKKRVEEIRGVKQKKHRIKKIAFQKNSSESAPISIQEFKKSQIEKKIQPDSLNHLSHQKTTKVTAPAKENKDCLSNSTSVLNENTGKTRSKMDDSEKTRDQLNLKADSQKYLNKQDTPCSTVHQGDLPVSLDVLKTFIKDGCTSLMDQRFRNAEQSFARLLNILDPSQLQELNLALIDYVVVIYGYATALLGIGQLEELAKAEDQFNKIIEQYQKVKFNCLAHYGIGKVYLRQNKFLDAMDQFTKSKIVISHKIVPGILTWPTTSIVIEETRTEKLQAMLEECIKECKFPPNPDAVCRYQQCQAHKMKIYFNDPDFKGFIRVTCCEQCIVEFHVSCWKKLKGTTDKDKNNKDFLQEMCFTPDCKGLITNIVVFSASGLIKHRFEHKIKPKELPRPVDKQKCLSSRSLQIKQEKKLRKKCMKEVALKATKDSTEECQRGTSGLLYDSHKGNIQKCFFTGDKVLQLIVQNAEKIKIGVHDAFRLLNGLLSCGVISEEDYAVFSTSSVSSNEVMEQLIKYLIQKNNRVKTRIFVHVLSELEEVDPKLHDWMKHLDDNGLKATEVFFNYYGVDILEPELSFISLLWSEKYGIKLNSIYTCSCPDYVEIMNYFEKLSVMELRRVLWLLEENREHFPLYHSVLDEYFDEMENPFTVLKKQEIETTANNGIKVKNRNRKKPKESRAVLVLSGGVGGTVTREEDNIFSEESTLSNYQRMLDNYPDPTCESLYDYFSQILEEHGPMEIDNPLLVGEYKCFPAGTRKIVEDAGGLKSFLLVSLRFVMMGDLIGLMKHAVMLKENADVAQVEGKVKNEDSYSACLNSQEDSSQSKPRLNPAAKEFKPIFYINQPCAPISSDKVTSNTVEYTTASHSSFSPFVSTCSLSCQTTDSIASSLPMSKISLPSAVPENYLTFLNEVPTDYQDDRTFPMITQIPLMPDISDPSNDIYADYDAYLDIDLEAISGNKYSFDSLEKSDKVQTSQNPECISARSDSHPYDNTCDQFESHHNEAECSSVIKMEMENKPAARNCPRSRMIAVQVDQELTDEGVNTLPLHPYETQQGDLLRIEKEHHVLQEQLKEASEKFEQLQSRSSEETSMLEDELKMRIDGNKLSQRELDWFHQDLEMEVKRWQQGKKENQDGLKVGKNKVRKLTETNEIYTRTIDEKDKQYKLHLDEFLEISNKFENEKVKMEELIKKSHNDYQECIKRAVAAEVSVLENWKDMELYKLHRRATNEEANLKYFKFMSSHSAVPQSKLQIDSWESFISNIKEEMRKTENQFEERICMVKDGIVLNSIPKVEIAEFQLPSGPLSAMHERPPINDPAIVMYSAAVPHLPPNLFATFSSSKDNSVQHSTVSVDTGNKTSHQGSKPSFGNEDLGEAPPECKRKLHSDKVCLPQSVGDSGVDNQDVQLEEPAASVGLDHIKDTNRPPLPKPSKDIIDELGTIFPHFTSSDFKNFIKEVEVKNRKKLNPNELLTLVTELILDHPNKKKVQSVTGKTEKPPSRASGQSGSKTQKVLKSLGRSVPNPSVSNEKAKKTTFPPQSVQVPWKTVGGASKTKWKKSSDVTDNDPCVICHEELSLEMLHVLDCGHRFHKVCIGPWIKEHSTCPTCRRHVLLPEDYPELPGRKRAT
ncbi:E3 ubiquitin-protein ligase TTC3 isoform X2 [Hemicordylus capensis]|uniref:E3 ubiquitin-protein ligase TTC3 isoform X2 n=1 Tax=Hemicordylus capensis TaxID=884348 RepID=UPI0023026BA5|nr:E3 ubiquitin-protein ligase TTC3 isoform X2 [Hemicordylus capensis]